MIDVWPLTRYQNYAHRPPPPLLKRPYQQSPPPTPRQHRRRAARRRATQAAGNAMNTHHAPRGHGRDRGAGDLRRHLRHLEHRNKGAHAHRPSSGTAAPRPQLRQEASLTPTLRPARVPRTTQPPRAHRASCGFLIKVAGKRFLLLEVRRDPEIRAERDETRTEDPPSRPPRNFEATLACVADLEARVASAQVRASHSD